MKVIKKLLVIILLFVGIAIVFNHPTQAANDPESSIHGFSVDNGAYTVNWDSRRTLNVYQSGAVKGTITTYVGVAHSNFVLSNGKHVSTIMIRSIVTPKKYTYTEKVLWWTNTITEYGTADELKYTMNFGSTELMDVDPKNQPTSNTYSIGVNAGLSASTSNGGTYGGSLGISASQTFTADALKIYNLSDTSANIASTSYQYQNSVWRWNWERDSYNFYESEQKAAYAVATTSRRYVTLIIYASFNSADATPSYWQNNLTKYSDNSYYASIYV